VAAAGVFAVGQALAGRIGLSVFDTGLATEREESQIFGDLAASHVD
jgi:hypothetical protein